MRESGSLMSREMPMPRLKKIHIKDGRPALPGTVGRGVPLPALPSPAKMIKTGRGEVVGQNKSPALTFLNRRIQ